ERAESVIVLTRQRHVMRIEREQAVDRSVLPDPTERLQPGVLRRGGAQFEMRRCRIHLALRIKHSSTEREKKQEPAIEAPIEYILTEQSAYDQKKQQVEQVQVAHGLEWPQSFETGRKHDDEP